jgi:hypothetical protein
VERVFRRIVGATRENNLGKSLVPRAEVRWVQEAVMELICLAIVLLFFGLSLGMVWLLERL